MATGVARALARRGHDVHLAGRREGELPAELDGVVVHAFPERASKLGQLRALLRLQARLHADVVHFHSALPHGELIAGLRMARAVLGSPRLCVTPWTSLRIDYPKRRARLGLRAADAVIAPSRWAAGHARRAGASAERLFVVQGGIDPVSAPPPEAREEAILFLGRLVAVKGVGVLLDAFGEAAATRPGWELWLGGEGRDGDALRAQAAASEVAERVSFLGHVAGEAKRTRLARAAIGAMPSEAESMGGSLLEFQAHGLACVVSDAGALPELALYGRAGILVPPRDPRALAAALGELMDDPARRADLAEAGREAGTGFSFDAVAEATERVYRGDASPLGDLDGA